MIRIASWSFDLSEAALTRLVQLGVDCVDSVPVAADDRGVWILDEAIALRKRLSSFGLTVNRMHIDALSEKGMDDDNEAERELNLACENLEVLGKARYPLVRIGFGYFTNPWTFGSYQVTHRGGYPARADSLSHGESDEPALVETQEKHWKRVCQAYERLVPIAEDYGLKLMMHASDPPTPDSLFGGLNYHRLIDAFPKACVGYLYCCGTRGEAGGLPLVLDEIHNYGRKGRIFEVHFRNVRGNFATAGAFEEVLLDDGDMNMFKILLELKRVGFDGCLHPDHYPKLEGDESGSGSQSLAYSIGYMKAMLAALTCL